MTGKGSRPQVYILSKLFDTIGSPSALLVLICVVGVILTLRRSSPRWSARLLVAGVGGLAAFGVLPLGSWMIHPLETRFPMPDPMPAHVDGIILLGGAIYVDRSVSWDRPVFNDAADRMTTFLAMAHRYPDAKLAFTGGNADAFADKTTEAAIARRYFHDVGLDKVVYESRSRNTHENAAFTKQLLKPVPGETWLIVASAADLPRAVGCFKAVGWSVTAIPSNYRATRSWWEWMPGVTSGLRQADRAAHEWIGLVYYRLRGWTPSLFPGPD